MKAVRLSSFGAPLEVAKVVDHDPGRPGPGEVLVEVLASPINPSDVLTLQGLYGLLPKLPAIPGNEGVGRVVEAGADSPVKQGEIVLLPMGAGTWCTHLKARADTLIVAPPGDLLQLSMLSVNPPTAELLLHEFVTLEPGAWVLQNAANSAVGRYLVVLAKRMGLKTVNVVRRAELEPELKALGADVVLVEGDDLARKVRQATGGAKVMLSIDAVGGASTGRLAEATANGGTVVCYGMMSGRPGAIPPGPLVFRDVRVRGFWLVRSFTAMSRERRDALFARLAALVADGTLHAPVDATFTLEEIGPALTRAMAEGRHGKVILTPNGALR